MLANLPTLVIEIIAYRHGLNYNDLISLRSTNRKLRSIINFKKSKKLNVFVQNHPFRFQLLYTNELIDYQNTLKCENANKLMSSLEFKNKFVHIQQLSIYHQTYSESLAKQESSIVIDLKCLNVLNSLEHLEVKCVKKLEGNKLSLKNLKICSLETEKESKFNLDSPKLKVLKFAKNAIPTLTNSTEELVYLSVGDLIDVDYLTAIFQKSKNLSIVSLDSIEKLQYFLTFLNFYIYTELDLESFVGIRLEQFYCSKFELASLRKKLFADLKKLKENAITEHINVYFNDTPIHLPEIKELSSLLFNQNSHAGFLQLIKSADMKSNDLVEFIKKNPILEFLYPSIQDLTLNASIKLDEKLVYSLRNLKNLKIENGFKFDKDGILFKLILETWSKLERLTLDKVNLTQDQLDQIPYYFHSLAQLTILNGSKAKRLDFSYLSKFKNLKHINVNFDLKKSDLISTYENCPSLIKVQFIKPTKESTILVDKKNQIYNIKVKKLPKKEIKKKNVSYELDESDEENDADAFNDRMHKFNSFNGLIEHFTTVIN